MAADPRAHAAAIPRRDVQYFESPEPGCAQREHHIVHLRADYFEERQSHCYRGAATRILVMRVIPTLLLCAAVGEAAVDPSTLDRKVLLGYQGWFTCPSDGSQRWTHWSRGVPTPETLTVDVYP